MARVRTPRQPATHTAITKSENFGAMTIAVDKPLTLDVTPSFLRALHAMTTQMMIGDAAKYGLDKAWQVSPPKEEANGTRAFGVAVDRSNDAPDYFRRAFRAVSKKAVRLTLKEWSPIVKT